MKIRHDKGPADCMSHQELIDLVKNFEGRYARRKTGAAADGEPVSKRRKVVSTRKVAAIAAPVTPVDPSKVEVRGHIFSGYEFWVQLSSKKKRELEELIIANGGSTTQNHTPNTYAVIADAESTFCPLSRSFRG